MYVKGLEERRRDFLLQNFSITCGNAKKKREEKILARCKWKIKENRESKITERRERRENERKTGMHAEERNGK